LARNSCLHQGQARVSLLGCYPLLLLLLASGGHGPLLGAEAAAPPLARIVADHAALAEKVQTGRIEYEFSRALPTEEHARIEEAARKGLQRLVVEEEKSHYLSTEQREATSGDAHVRRAASIIYLARTGPRHVQYRFDKQSDSQIMIERDLRDLQALSKEYGLGSQGKLGIPETTMRAVVGDCSLNYESEGNVLCFLAQRNQGVSAQRLLKRGFVTSDLIRDGTAWTCEAIDGGLVLLKGKPGRREWHILLDPAVGYRVVRSEAITEGVTRFLGEYEYAMWDEDVFLKQVREVSYDAHGALSSRELYRIESVELNCALTPRDFALQVPDNAMIADPSSGLLYRDADPSGLVSEETETVTVGGLASDLLQLEMDKAQDEVPWQPGVLPRGWK
jgi:hypothetical protein